MKKGRRGYVLLKSIFLRNRSLSNVGDFTVKNASFGKESVLTANQLHTNTM